MKLEALIPETKRRMSQLDEARVLAVRDDGIARHLYVKDWRIWFAAFVRTTIYTPDEVCQMYREYGCNDEHIRSLIIHCCKKRGWI